MPTKVYTFGAKLPAEGGDLVEESIRQGHRYYNALVALHRRRIEATAELQRRCLPDLAAAETAVAEADAAVDGLRDEVKRRNAQARRKSPTAVDKALIAAARATLKQARVRLKEMRSRSAGAGLAAWALELGGATHGDRLVVALEADTRLTEGRGPTEIDQVARAELWVEFGRAAGDGWAAFAETAENALLYQREKAAIWAAFSGGLKAAYNDSPCWWGTKLKIAEMVEKAVEAVSEFGGLPRFRRWEQVRFDPVDDCFVGAGDGLAAVQLQGGLPVSELTARTDNRLRMEMGHEGRPARTSTKRAKLVTFWVRLGSDGREPRWAKVPAYYHQELPADGQILWAAVVRRAGEPRRQADGSWRPYYKFEVQLTVRTGETRPTASSGACGVNLGWRVLGDGSLRTAVAVGDDGAVHELRLPRKLLDRWSLAEDLQRRRDLHFDAARACLADWLRGLPAPPALAGVVADLGQRAVDVADAAQRERLAEETAVWRQWAEDFTRPELPAWLQEEAQWVARWKSHARLAQLLDRWAAHPFSGGEVAFRALTAWREREAHLLGWEIACRHRAARYRGWLQGSFAARLARRYRVVAVEDTDYRQILRQKPAEDATDDAAVREHHRHAAPGKQRQLLKNRAAVYVNVKAENISAVHSVCGTQLTAEERANRRKTITVHCEACGVAYDQDESAAAVVLARAKALDGSLGTARGDDGGPQNGHGNGDGTPEGNGHAEKGGRWGRRKASRSRKAGQMKAAQ